tara:strand:+ start:483 stop:725 length:243 start_codon:yes stop_codon:yes gene_type:complete
MIDEERINELYNKLFATNVQLSEEYSIIEVASVTLGQAMRLYKTVLNDEEFEEMVRVITSTSNDVRPYDEFCLTEKSTCH